MANTTVYPFGTDGQLPSSIGVINDLTTGGANKALSAEQGKILGDTLDVDVDTDTVTRLLTPSEHGENVGYLSASATTGKRTPQTGSTEYGRYSDPISLKTGDVLYIKAATNDNVARLSKYVEGATYDALMILQGTLSSSDINNGITYETIYTAQEDFDALVGWNWKGDIEIKITRQENVVTSKADMIEPMAEVLDFSSEATTETSPIILTGSNGYYQGVDASLSGTTSSNYKHSDFVSFKAGDVLTIDVKNVATSAKVLVRKEGDKVRGLISGNNDTQHITYTVPYDAQYAFSWLNSTGITVTKTVTINGSSARLDALEENAASKDDVEDLEDAVFSIVNDDMTTGYVDGKYIAHNGTVLSNNSFAYKEFSVRKGAVINFTGLMHPNLAAIAKKLTSNTFEELVPATAQSVQSFTYTATEDMTIAVSFNKGSDRSITIVTQNIEANTLNIEAIYNILDLVKRPDYGTFFDKVAVIGDSLTVGTLDAATGDDGHVAGGSFGCSWLTYLAKKWGSSIRMHYGVGGSTCYSWLGSNSYGLGLMLKDSVVYDVYFVAYGHNDAGKFTIGTTSDTPTAVTVDAEDNVTVDTPAADTTFLGNYKKIVNEIRTKAPNALIFMVCTDKKDSTASSTIGYMNQYIRQLAEWYYGQGDHKVFYLDYISKYVEKAGYHTGGHWSTFGYANIGRLINDAVNDVIEAHLGTNALKVWGNYLESYRTTRNDQTRSGGYLPHL